MKHLSGAVLPAVLIAAVLLLNHLPLGHPLEVYVATFIVASVLYLWLARVTLTTEVLRGQLWMLIAASILLRASFLPVSPVGSDDVYRYIWDGRVEAHGINPYRYAPEAPELQALHSEALPAKVNYPSMKTVYFPVAQWFFLAGYELSGEALWGYKLVLLIAEILTILGLLQLLRAAEKPVKFVLLYALCPISVVSLAIDSHVDGLGLVFLVFALALYLRRAAIPAFILLGLSISVKPVALVLLPIIFFNEEGMRNRILVLMIPGIILIAQFLPYLGGNPFESLQVYTAHWTFNGGIFNALYFAIHDNQLTRLMCGVLLLCSVVLTVMSKVDFLTKAFLGIFLLLVFSPVVHPWYVVWLAVLLPVAPRWSGLTYATTASLATITVLSFGATGVWEESPIVLALEYLPVAVLFFRELPKRRAWSGLPEPDR